MLSMFFVYKTGERTSFIIIFFSVLVVLIYQIYVKKFDFLNKSLIAVYCNNFYCYSIIYFENLTHLGLNK